MLNLKDFAEAWIIMWGLSYIITAIVAPNISETPAIGYGVLGFFILFVIVLMHLAYDKVGYHTLGGALMALGSVMTYGGVVSWSGVGLWNVPFPNKELFQVSMAFADLLSAVFMLLLAIDLLKKK